VDGDIGRCVASLKVEEEHTNPGGTLHGGLSAVLVDNVSTLALALPDEDFKFGVSVDMNLSYIKAAAIGQEILIDAKVLKRGRTLAFLEVELRNKETNDLLVKGSHTKFIG
jgi:acyl-coenzyme A thioesterase 13